MTGKRALDALERLKSEHFGVSPGRVFQYDIDDKLFQISGEEQFFVNFQSAVILRSPFPKEGIVLPAGGARDGVLEELSRVTSVINADSSERHRRNVKEIYSAAVKGNFAFGTVLAEGSRFNVSMVANAAILAGYREKGVKVDYRTSRTLPRLMIISSERADVVLGSSRFNLAMMPWESALPWRVRR